MLKKRIRKLLQAFVLGDDADKFVTDIVSNLPATVIEHRIEHATVNIGDGDIIVFPSSISNEDLERISSFIPSGKRIGVAAADGVSIIKLS